MRKHKDIAGARRASVGAKPRRPPSTRWLSPWPRIGLVLALVSTGVIAGTGLPAAAAASSVSNASVAGTNTLYGVACSGATTCLAVGDGPSGGVVVPITGGVPGSAVQAAAAGVLDTVACPTATTCVAVGYNGNDLTTGAGVAVLVVNERPVASIVVSGTRGLNDVACPAAGTCVAVGASTSTFPMGMVVPLTIAGSTLTAASPVDVTGTDALFALSCPDTADCVAAGQDSASGDGAFVALTLGTGSPPSVSVGAVLPSSGSYNLYGIACTNATTCLGAGLNATGTLGVVVPYASSAAGLTQQVAGTSSLSAVACPTTTSCAVVGTGSSMGVSTTATLSGAAAPVSGDAAVGYFNGVACPSPLSCVAVGHSSSFTGPGIVATIPGPASGGPPGPPTVVPGATGLTGLACPTSTVFCLGVGAGTASVNEGGAVETVDGFAYPVEPVAGTTNLAGIACPDALVCLAVGQNTSQGVVVMLSPTPDGIPSTGPVQSVAGTSVLDAVACEPGSGTCLAMGDNTTNPNEGVVVPLSIQFNPGGATVSVGTPVSVPGTSFLYAVACPASGATCLAAGATASGAGAVLPVSLSGGTATPGAVVSVPGTSSLNAVACLPTGTTCLAAGQTSGVLTGAVVPVGLSAGATGPSAVAGTVGAVSASTGLYGLACPGATSCEAVGTFVTTGVIDGVVVPVGLSGTSGGASSTSATAGAVASVAGTSILLALACASATTCETAGYYNNTYLDGLLAPAPPATVPGAPTGLTATPGNDQVSLSWAAPSSDGGLAVTGYDIYQGTAAGQETTTPVNSSPVTGTAYTVKGLSAGTKYYFTVEAVNAVGNGPASNEASATTPATVPGAPTGLTATPGSSQVSLSWTAPSSDGGSPVTGYDVYEGTSSGGESSTPVNSSPVTGTSYAVKGLSAGTEYYFTVEAVNAVGNGPASNEASATPVAPSVTTTTTTTTPAPTTTTTTTAPTTTTTPAPTTTTTTTTLPPAPTTTPVPLVLPPTTTTTPPTTTTTPPPPPAPHSPPPVVAGSAPTSGPPSGGTTVEVVGHHLCSVREVLFGSTRAPKVRADKSCTSLLVTAPPGHGTVQVRVLGPGGRLVALPETYTYAGPGALMVTKGGVVYAAGSARTHGDMPAHHAPVVAIATTPGYSGYWLFTSTGEVYSFGDARSYGSVPGVLGREHKHLAAPVVAAEATANGRGYRLFAADGGVFDFGDARFLGSLPGLSLAPRKPVSGGASAMAAVPDPVGRGYWLVSADGGVFAFGDARFHGSLGGRKLQSPVVGMVATPDGGGYWLVSADGAVHAFGDAPHMTPPAGKVAGNIVAVS